MPVNKKLNVTVEATGAVIMIQTDCQTSLGTLLVWIQNRLRTTVVAYKLLPGIH